MALVQDRPVLGGNASSEIRVWLSGDTSDEPLDPRETGIVEELVRNLANVDRSEHFEAVVRAEPGIDIHLNTRATGARMRREGVIRSVLALNVLTGERHEFSGRLFADCTGDGWLGYWAGADYRTGREGRDEFDEPAAPRSPDPHSLSTSLTGTQIEVRDEPVPFHPPEWAHRWESCEDFDPGPKATQHSVLHEAPEGFHRLDPGRGRHPESANPIDAWWLEVGGMRDTIHDAESIRDELFRIKLGLWDHVKNHCPRFAGETANREFVSTNHIAGKRESRRLLGDYILAQRDYAERIIHPDTVTYAGYNIDPHHPQGFWTLGPQAFRLYHFKASVPYRILYSRNVDNLFMAGRNISATHLALNGVRVMRITAMMGEVVGTAASVALANESTPRGVYEDHLAQLQQTLLHEGTYLMGVPNQDPLDLALTATVTASSEAVSVSPANAVDGWNRAVHGVPHSWGPDPSAPRPHWIELRFDAACVLAMVHVTFQLREMAARSYRICIPTDDGWHTVVDVTDNRDRRRVHEFKPATCDRLRIFIDDPDARICEIRAYE